MTYLLAAGCSWTDANFKSDVGPPTDCTFPKWPELLGKQLGIRKVKNVGSSGASNTYIFNKCYESIVEKKPELVCILLSTWDRVSIFNYHINLYYLLQQSHVVNSGIGTYDEWTEMYKKYYQHLDRLVTEVWNSHINVDDIVNENLKNIMLFQDFCDKNKINYIIMQGIGPIGGYEFLQDPYCYPTDDPRLKDHHEYIYSMLVSDFTRYINTKNIIGWPFFDHAGLGYTIDHIFFSLDDQSGLRVNEADEHPGPKGHAVIADHFFKGVKNVYPKYRIKNN